jgi:glycosyltransferase involved in cell wall biosynthesis
VLDQCRHLLRVREERSLLAPNGRDPAEFRPPEHRMDPRAPVLAFVGAFNPGKRPGRFVEVVGALRKDDVALRAFMCGDGPLAAELAGPAAAAGVELLGSRDDVAAVLRDADVFVFPSLPTGEGMPGVLIEAGLSGLAVVATAVPGARTIVEDGTSGFIVDVDDLDAMVQATKRLLVTPGLRRAMGDAGRRRCEQRFSLEAVAACWLSFLEPLVARSAPRTPHAGG